MGEPCGGLGRARVVSIGQLVLVGLVAASAATAQPQVKALDGTEFLVGGTVTGTSNTCTCPAIDMDANGNYVIVWEDRSIGTGHVLAQRYSTLGVANGSSLDTTPSASGERYNPAVSMDDIGEVVVAFQGGGIETGGGFGIGAQSVDSTGSLVGGTFQVNTYTPGFQYFPELEEDAAGNFVIAWSGPHPSSTSTEIRARRFDDSATPLGSDFVVNAATTGIQRGPRVAVDASDNFVIVWSSAPTGADYGVIAKRFDSSGGVLNADFQVNQTGTGVQYSSDVVMTSGGGFIIAWQSESVDPADYAVMGRVYDSSGSPLTGEIQLNAYTTSDQVGAKLGVDAAGNVVAIWQSFDQDGDDYGIFGRVFDSSLAAITGEFQLNTYTTGLEDLPEVAVDAAGNFVATWRSKTQNAGNQGVYARRYLGPCSESLPLIQGKWHLIGLPCEPPAGADTLMDVFGDDLNPGDYGVTWAVWRRNATSNAYEMLTLSDTLSVHVGYWIQTTLAGKTIDVEGNNADYTDISSTSYFATHGGGHDAALVGAAGICSDGDLTDGRFNLLGHPYRTSVPFSGVLLDNGSSEETVLQAATGERMMNQMWWWNGSAYQAKDACTPAMKGSLDKWMGYWVNVCDTSGSYTSRTPARAYDFCPPPGPPVGPETSDELVWEGRTLRPDPTRPKPGKGDPWYLRITATSGTLSDPGNVLGELWDSVAGYDSHDLVELPPFGSPWLTVVFPHLDWGSNSSEWFTSDYHGFHDERLWSFEVRSDTPRIVTLDFALTQLGKKAPQLEVIDEVSGAVVAVEEGSYTFTMASSRHAFTVREARGRGRY